VSVGADTDEGCEKLEHFDCRTSKLRYVIMYLHRIATVLPESSSICELSDTQYGLDNVGLCEEAEDS
jgi:hypothetical protein